MVSSWAYDIVANDSRIDKVIILDAPWFERPRSGFIGWVKCLSEFVKTVREGQYDVCIDLRGDFRQILAMYLAGVKKRIGFGITGGGFMLTDNVPHKGVKHETERNLELIRPLGVARSSEKICLTFSDTEKKEAEKLISQNGVSGRYAILHVTPGHDSKKWYLKNFADITQYLFQVKKITPIIVGASSDRDIVLALKVISGVELIDLTGKTTFGILYYIIKGSELFVGVDSAPAHIAAASEVPAVILFSGINDPAQWAPRGDNVKLIYPGRGKDLSGVSCEEVIGVIDRRLG